MSARHLLVTYVLVNAVLYSVLMPLWEGFDEPFHFAYVQQLANGQGFPDPRATPLSREVGDSLLLAPASEAVKQNLPQVTTYAQYFSWPVAKRAELRRELSEIPEGLRWQPSQFVNYEGHQPPLSYLLLAMPERLLAGVSLPVRIMLLRILAAAAGALLVLYGAERLFSQIGIPGLYSSIALFCLFSWQMLWATLAHVGNDWLAVPIAVWMLVAMNRYHSNPNVRAAAVAAFILALGLLTKAYFLAFVPLLAGLCARRRRGRELAAAFALLCVLAGPWYARNLMRYGVLTGTQEARAGIGLEAVLRTAPTMNWAAVIKASVHSAMWTGNNTFLTFSASTLNLMMGVFLVALLLWAVSRHTDTEWITVAYCALFVFALGYSATASYIFTGGAATGPSPWYAQIVSAPLLGLALLGASRWQRLGRLVAVLLVLLFGYVLAATYAVKFIPLYGGYGGRTSAGGLAALYVRGLKSLTDNLDTAALGPAMVIYGLTGIVVGLVVVQQIVLIRGCVRTRFERTDR